MSTIRLWHTYIGILIAPSVIFFALTGALQIFNLHEAHDHYEPPALIEKLSSLHKDQVFAQKSKDEEGPAPAAAPGEPAGEHTAAAGEHTAPASEHEGPAPATTLLKWFFLLVAVALTTTTLLGLWIGLTHIRRKRTGWWLLAAGIFLPVFLAAL